MHRFAYWFGLAACVLLCNGCATFSKLHHSKKKKTEKQEQAKPEPHQMVGDVAMVNLPDKFVLINVGTLFQPPPPGQALKCFRDQKSVAILAVSHERNPPFIVANIVQGTPQQGDTVVK